MQDLKVTRDGAVGTYAVYGTQLANSGEMSYDPNPYGTPLPGYYPSHYYGYHLSPPYGERYDAGYADLATSRDSGTLEEDGGSDSLVKRPSVSISYVYCVRLVQVAISDSAPLDGCS